MRTSAVLDQLRSLVSVPMHNWICRRRSSVSSPQCRFPHTGSELFGGWLTIAAAVTNVIRFMVRAVEILGSGAVFAQA